jgi:hypothetical protein
MGRQLDIPLIGVSIYHWSIYLDGFQNTMTKMCSRSQNTIWYIEPGVDFSGVQNTI